MPDGTPAIFAPTVTVPASVPEVGVRVNHPDDFVTVQFNVPAPTLSIFSAWVGGLGSPAVAEKTNEVGSIEIAPQFNIDFVDGDAVFVVGALFARRF